MLLQILRGFRYSLFPLQLPWSHQVWQPLQLRLAVQWAPAALAAARNMFADPWKQPAVIDLKFGAALKSARATRVSGRATRVSLWGSLLLVLYVGSFAAYMLARISSTISVHDKLFPYQVSACCCCTITRCDLLAVFTAKRLGMAHAQLDATVPAVDTVFKCQAFQSP